MENLIIFQDTLLSEIRQLLRDSRSNADKIVNSIITTTYWKIGEIINRNVLKSERAVYGNEIVSTLSRQLAVEFGRGFSEKSLRHIIRFSQVFPDFEIVSTLSRQLSWSHFKEIIYLDDDLKMKFYIELSILENWSVRTLRNRMDSLLYERTALSSKPEELIEIELGRVRNEKFFSPNTVLKDPYLLDFLGIKDHYLEKDLEDAILRDIQNFLLELGTGFSFIERQKRITIDSEDFYLDLLFYNRILKRLVVVELKTTKFKAEYKGQMELYLRWLEKHEKQEEENSPIGIILCTHKNFEQIELLELDKSGIHVAEYLTVLPSKEQLRIKIEESISKRGFQFEK